MSQQSQDFKPLLTLARKTIEFALEGRKYFASPSIKKQFSEKKACFVTLTKNGNLRGCVGSLEARQELWKDVQENAINSSFHDPRFPELTKEELKDIKIEISILIPPKDLDYKNPDDLLNKLKNNMGIIINCKGHCATYLPQVWEQIPDKKEFLSSLCSKAGLSSSAWKNEKMNVQCYFVEKVEE